MAKFDFRHGIARRQEDGNGTPTFLKKNGQYIDLIVSPDPTVILIAHRDENYMYTENVSVTQAWGPFQTGYNYWLFWDVSFVTGELSRSFTTHEPVVASTEPTNPGLGQCWFDTAIPVMKEWDGACWKEVIRVFACKYSQGAVLSHYPTGTQIGIGGPGQEHFAGSPLFSADGKPLSIWQRDRRGRFITTETPLNAQFSRNANFRVEAAINQAEAVEPVPIHYCIAYSGTGGDKVMLARNDRPTAQGIGIAAEEMVKGETRSFVTQGFVTSDLWNWQVPSGTRLFVGPQGQLTTVVPTQDSVQEMGQVVSNSTVFVNPQVIKTLNRGSVRGGNYIGMYTDRLTGEEILWDREYGPGMLPTWGYVHHQKIPATLWTVNHNGGTVNVTAQVRDPNNNVILPTRIEAIDDNTLEIDFDAGESPNATPTGNALLIMFGS